MSDTDKTKPVWVKIAQNPELRLERHYHYNRECDLEDKITKNSTKFYFSRRTCYVWVKRGERKNLYNITSSWLRSYIDEQNGSSRTTWRMHVREMLKMCIEDIEDYDYNVNPHRHNAWWEAY